MTNRLGLVAYPIRSNVCYMWYGLGLNIQKKDITLYGDGA